MLAGLKTRGHMLAACRIILGAFTARLKPSPPQVSEEIAKSKKDRTKKTQDPPSKTRIGHPARPKLTKRTASEGGPYKDEKP